jgi:hypothetical protein
MPSAVNRDQPAWAEPRLDGIAARQCFEKARFMTEPSTAPEKAPDVADTVGFLRRFADLMATGYNAAYLRRAADLLETLTARVIATADEDALWRYKYETLSRHADALETECEALKQDIEGHLDITASVIRERDALGVKLKATEAEVSALHDTLSRERDERAAKSATHDEALAGLRGTFDREREALKATLQTRSEEGDELRRALERERAEHQAQLKVRGDELAAFRVVSERERDTLREKLAALEAKRAELRAAFDRISDLRDRTVEHQGGAGHAAPENPGFEAELASLAAVGDADAVVPKDTLRQARAQFEYLAKECIPRGDIATQVMCELAAYTMDLALIAGQKPEHLRVGEVAKSILARAAG